LEALIFAERSRSAKTVKFPAIRYVSNATSAHSSAAMELGVEMVWK